MPLPPPNFMDTGRPFSPAVQGAAQTNAAASFLGGGFGEFDHAIQFLNKIKTRFPEDPDTYKIFLEILQSYRVQQAQGGEHDTASQAARDQRLMQDVRPISNYPS